MEAMADWTIFISGCLLAFGLFTVGFNGFGAEALNNGRKSLVMESQAARLVVDLGGGSIGDFRLKGGDLNPLNWNAPPAGTTSSAPFGHFLCLDRWGPPSQA